MSQHIGPRTISAIGGSIKRVGNYRIHTFPAELVTDGLVLNLDAGDPRSYPSSGTTWTDLSGNGNNGEIISCGYSNENGGHFDFTAVNSSRVSIDNFNQISSSYTVEIWFKSDEVVNYRNVCDMNYGVHQADTGPRLEQQTDGLLRWYTTASLTGTSNNVIQLGYISAGTIYHAVITYDSTNRTYSGYLNGNQTTANQAQLYGGDIPFDSVKLGVGFNNTRFYDGEIFAFRIYNRALSAAEVAQNYDALRVRYGSYTSTFTPICAGGEGKVEVLCVAGGGGGAVGGGGAGGLIYNSAFAVGSNSAISLSVGNGGRGAPSWGPDGSNGNDSTFGSLTAIYGGRGGHGGEATAGGSGGGAGYAGTGRASGTAGQGNAGGRGGDGTPYYPGGGGGGAGSSGADGVGITTAGNGGSGLAYSISGTSQFYAGGGGGATQGGGGTKGIGGSGVGGDGVSGSGIGTNGIPNTGSGGGGGGSAPGANGSNGTVIVRYPATDYNVEVLVVGGGGGGGGSAVNGAGGGGGAGGHVYYSSYAVSSGKKINVSVGKGGNSGGYNTTSPGENGGNSIFDTSLVAFGGGGGGPAYNTTTPFSLYDGKNGASGGGAGSNGTQRPGGIGILGQGNDGGFGADGTGADGAGGGGGAGTAGGNGGAGTANSFGGNGGDGIAYSITGTSTYYCGGGGGGGAAGQGQGGLGGGGNVNTNGSTNTGGGGGGGAYATSNHNGGNGGSGIVIIAYKGPQRGIGGTVDTTSRPGYTLHKFTTTGTDFFIP